MPTPGGPTRHRIGPAHPGHCAGPAARPRRARHDRRGVARRLRSGAVRHRRGPPRPGRAPISPGTIICDVARPPDAGPAVRGRADVTVIDGGLIALPNPALTFGPGNLQGLPPGIALACLSETILHALEGTRVDCGVGDEVPIEQADLALALCRRHGFRVTARSAGHFIPERPSGRRVEAPDERRRPTSMSSTGWGARWSTFSRRTRRGPSWSRSSAGGAR